MRRYLIIAIHNRYGFTKTKSFNERHEAFEEAVKMILDGYTVKIRDNATGKETYDI